MTYEIEATAPFYKGSGVAVAAIKDGSVIDAVYTNDDIMAEREIKASLAEKHQGASLHTGMMSAMQFTAF